jgi:DNA-directed RNA polymerase subunit RPC12/RpoP
LDFFKRCPSCGRRFVAVQGAKTLVDRETAIEKEAHFAGTPSVSGKGGAAWVVTEDDIPVEYDSFAREYTCKRCLHKWTERVTARRPSS